jgi:hypothetical protein
MNPYLEQEAVWNDFHQRFVPHVAEALSSQVRPGYIVTIDSHVYLHELPGDERRFMGRHDAAVLAGSDSLRPQPRSVSWSEPVAGTIPVAIDTEIDSYITIRDRLSREIVTVIEFLSPSNKRPGGDREQYLGKRREYLRSSAHLVEIDLLCGWPRMPMQGLPDCDYVVLVSRSDRRPKVDLFPIQLRDPLKPIPVPLRIPDPDVNLDLHRILTDIYDAAGYEDYIYDGTPQPALPPEDRRWAQQFLPKSPDVTSTAG